MSGSGLLSEAIISEAPPLVVCNSGGIMTGRVLGAGLRQRHLAMIALGGAIGAGLFVGSGFGIAAAGPGILVSYVCLRRPDRPGDAHARRDVGGPPGHRLVRRARAPGVRAVGRAARRMDVLGAARRERRRRGRRGRAHRRRLGACRAGLGVGGRLHERVHREQPGGRTELRRAGVLVRRPQDRRDRRFSRARRRRPRRSAARPPVTGDRPPHRRRRLPAARLARRRGRHGGGRLRVRRPGDGDHRRGRVRRPGPGGPCGRTGRHVAGRRLLPRLDGRHRHPRSVERPGRRRRPVRRRGREHRRPRRRRSDGGGRPRRAPVGDERQHLRLLAHAVRPGRTRRRTPRPGPGADRRPVRGRPRLRRVRLRLGRPQPALAAYGLPVPAQLHRRRDPARLGPDRRLPPAPARPFRTRGARARGDRRGAALHAGRPDEPDPAPHDGGWAAVLLVWAWLRRDGRCTEPGTDPLPS